MFIFFYAVVYFFTCNWLQIIYLLKNFLKPKRKIKALKNQLLITKYKKITGLTLIIKIMEEKKMVGFMLSIPPFKPVMMLSSRLYQDFNKNELDWVILHECAHYLMWHNLRYLMIEPALFLIGIYLVLFFQIPFTISLLFFLILSIIFIQIAKIFEYQADHYAVTHMINPKGMITGNIKMKKANSNMIGAHPFIKPFFTIALSYEKRIQMAKNELKLRRL